jgi:hypothetical protein
MEPKWMVRTAKLGKHFSKFNIIYFKRIGAGHASDIEEDIRPG